MADEIAETSRFVIVDDYELSGGIVREGLPDHQAPVERAARTAAEFIVELRTGKFSNMAQDREDGGVETLRRDCYM